MTGFKLRQLSSPEALRDRLVKDILDGFSQQPKYLPPKYFYDAAGSEIFEAITKIPEYYVTDCETEALKSCVESVIRASGTSHLLELGSGSSTKTRLLLSTMHSVFGDRPVQYTPFDISPDAVEHAGHALLDSYPWLTVEGLVGDFLTDDLDVVLADPTPKLVAFLGSTFGNLLPLQRHALLKSFEKNAGTGDYLLLGVDLATKDSSIIELAYNDPAGVTAEFNLNAIRVLEQQLAITASTSDFTHRAPYVVAEQRIEMRLYAARPLTLRFSDARLPDYHLDQGDYILTEISHKFTFDSLQEECESAGVRIAEWHTDEKGWVSLALISKN